MRRSFPCRQAIAAFVLVLSGASLAGAAEVTIPVSQKLTASARYEEGDPDKPAILLLHGFLQSANFFTTRRLGKALADHGYTVLRPTLSLGVPAREESLECEAVHTHTMTRDLSEISNWARWLEDAGHERIILIGHSFGGVQALAYLASEQQPAPRHMIGISLPDLGHGMGEDQPRAVAEPSASDLRVYSMSYCDRYPAPPDAFHSYARWDREHILRGVKEAEIPIHVISGSDDKRMGEDWRTALTDVGAKVHTVPGADHFFDGLHEFDLAEVTLEIVDSLP